MVYQPENWGFNYFLTIILPLQLHFDEKYAEIKNILTFDEQNDVMQQ